MKQGFVKMAAATPVLRVADCPYNKDAIAELIREMASRGAKVMVFPELCITGYTCEDLFWQDLLLQKAQESLGEIAEESKDVDALIFVGLPLEYEGKLYNVTAALNGGRILGIVPKACLPTYNEFYEGRHFTPGMRQAAEITVCGQKTWIGTDLLFVCENYPRLSVAAEICEDLWMPNPPSIRHALAGASVIVNPSASDELTGKDSYRRELVKGQSARLVCAYLYASAGEGESSTDLVFGAHNLICENGTLLAQMACSVGSLPCVSKTV